MKRITILIVFAGMALAGNALAKTCELTITGNDQIQYDKSELVIEAGCTEVKLTLKHVGNLPVEQMGHNWTLSRTSDWQDIAQTGQAAGAENDYLPRDDNRIIAHTDMIGGGESTSITFDVSRLETGGEYTYFCSFPGHWAIMNGTLIVK